MKPETLRQLIEAAGESQRSFARILGIDHSCISRYCSGETPIPEEIALRAIAILIPRAQCRIELGQQILAEFLSDDLDLATAGKE